VELEQKADPPAATSCETSLNTDEVVFKVLVSVISKSFCYKGEEEREREIAQ